MRRVLVAGNGGLPPLEILLPWVRRAETIVAADGGANGLFALGIEPDHVVGDLDSLRGSSRRRLKSRRIHRRADPRTTDLDKCLQFVHEQGARDVTVVGVSEGRLDHVLAATALLLEWSPRLTIRFVDSHFTTTVVRRRARFRAPIGSIVSLFSPSEAQGVTATGLRWPLRDASLPRGTLGIHNHVVSNPVTVLLASGELLLLRSHHVEPHGEP